jgi:hypothetical protein
MVVLVEPDLAGRRALDSLLRHSGVSVASFADPQIAFLFLLARVDEVEEVLVNDDGGAWSDWLRRRLELLYAASLPPSVESYSALRPPPRS